jgi:hypothetical protein
MPKTKKTFTQNLLVGMTGEMGMRIKEIALANQVGVPVVIRMLLARGLESIEKRPLVLESKSEGPRVKYE